MPAMASKDAATHATLDLIQCLQHPMQATPFLVEGNEQMDALWKLADTFKKSLPQPQQSIPHTAPQQMRAPFTVPCLHTCKPTAQGQQYGNMCYIHYSPPVVPMESTRVNQLASPPVSINNMLGKTPIPHQMVNPTAGKTPMSDQTELAYCKTRVP
eukprot:15366817-Ditylum_brightwellii.AAC.2